MSSSLPVVRLGPQMLVGLGIDELRDDAHAVAGAAHAAVEQRRRRRAFAPISRRLCVALLERHDRGARDHLERADLREMRDDVLGDAVGEVLVLRIGAEVARREARRRRRTRARRRRRGERARRTAPTDRESVGGILAPAHAATASSIAAGTSERSRRIDGAGSIDALGDDRRAACGPLYGGSPASISYSMQARLY